jgi:hypothetical protein
MCNPITKWNSILTPRGLQCAHTIHTDRHTHNIELNCNCIKLETDNIFMYHFQVNFTSIVKDIYVYMI